MRVAVLVVVLALVPASGVDAATVTLEYEAPIPEIDPDPAYTLVVEAVRGETNLLRVAQDESGFVVREGGSAPLSAAAGCSMAAPGVVRCPLPGGPAYVSVFVDAGDGADAVVLGPLFGLDVAEVLGGEGDDALVGHSGPDLLVSGAGADMVAGSGGSDRIDGGPDGDTLDGGDGRDLITYASHSRPVAADLAAGTGGGRGEQDRLTAFEDLAGGSASDRLLGDRGSNLLFGGLGGRKDTGRGRGGDDVLTLRGRAVGGPGDDTLDAEHVDCGRGSDLVFRQRFDAAGPYARACERIRRFFYVVTRPRVVRRRLILRFTCPAPACRGRVTVRDRRGRLGAERYAADNRPSGRPRTVRIRVRLERRPAGRIGSFVITGRSSARDAFRVRLD